MIQSADSHEEVVEIWGVALPARALNAQELEYVAALPREVPPNEWVWSELDRVWHAFGLDNRLPLSNQPIGEFYGHPVWLMNGVFSAADPTSSAHRSSIADFVASSTLTRVADYGGGFGELARAVTERSPESTVTIVEPFPSAVAQSRLRANERVEFADRIDGHFDVVIAQDVLEHVEAPVKLAAELAGAVRPGGVVIFANNFTPVIECHLPRTFHLRYTFRLVMSAMGLRYRGRIDGAEHAQVFEVSDSIRPRLARAVGLGSQLLWPLLRPLRVPIPQWVRSRVPRRHGREGT